MKPIDPRLVRQARATGPFLAATTALSLAGVALVIAQASILAYAISAVFLDGADWDRLRDPLAGLAAIVGARAVLAWGQEVTAHRAAAGVKTQLRQRLLTHAMRLGPAWLHGQRTGEMATLATRGLDALDAYFARYLPQLVLAALVPAAILAWLFPADLVAGVTIALTLPLIPIFMALVGWTTEKLNARQFSALTRLAHHLLEVIGGLPTLKALARARAQAEVIRRLTDDQRQVTMRTLRLAFLSSLVLELLATLSVALVAVGIGLRVVNGSLDLRTAFMVLILAPEAYLPLRQLSAHYHASAEGVAAAAAVFDVLQTPVPRTGQRTVMPDLRRTPILVEDLSVTYPARDEPALRATSLRLDPGEVVAIRGPSGCGKSTLLNVLLGFVRPTSGRVMLGDGSSAVDLADLDSDTWRSQLAYVPQRPYLFAGTVASNIALGRDIQCPERDPVVMRAADEAGLAGLTNGLATMVEDDGVGLSAGQRQRVALARALLRDSPVLILDEPTANLDHEAETEVIAVVRRLARHRTVLLVAHRPALVSVAHRVIDLAPQRQAVSA